MAQHNIFYRIINNFAMTFLSVYIIPVDAHTNINTYEAANKADEITCHHSEPCAKPPANPTKECDAEYDS